MTGHPYTASKGESLVHSLFRFKNGKMASLYCHYMDIPMTPLPFFQIFGTKVGCVIYTYIGICVVCMFLLAGSRSCVVHHVQRQL